MKRCEHCTVRLGTVIIGRMTSGLTPPCPSGMHSFIEIPALPKRPRKPVHRVRHSGRTWLLKPGHSYIKTLDGRILRRVG